MTQSKLSAFFRSSSHKKTAPKTGEDCSSETRLEKRVLDDIDDNSGTLEKHDVVAVVEPPEKKTACGKKIEVTAASLAFAAPSKSSPTPSPSPCLPPALTAHPVLQSLDAMDDGWRHFVVSQAGKPYFSRLLAFLSQEITSRQVVYPPYPLVFSALTLCSWLDVRVVIIGQDPYHGPNQAHGLAFSVLPPTQPPPSLNNMFKEAMEDVSGFTKPSHGNLEAWSRQGVLLLNTVLTVRRGQANSHKGKGWETFTDAVIKELDVKKKGLVFVLWGKPAQVRL